MRHRGVHRDAWRDDDGQRHWTGTGPIFSHKGKSRFDDGTCVQVNADKTRSREASFDGSIEAQWATIGDGSFTFRSNCFGAVSAFLVAPD